MTRLDRRQTNRQVRFKDRRLGGKRRVQVVEVPSERRCGFISSYTPSLDRRAKNCAVTKDLRSGKERRQTDRLVLDLPVKFEVGGKKIDGRACTLSGGGVSVLVGVLPKPGDILNLQFAFGQHFCYMNLPAIVVHREAFEGQSDQYLLGLRFDNLPVVEKKVLYSMVEELKSNKYLEPSSSISILLSKPRKVFAPAKERAAVRKSCQHMTKVVGWGSYLPGDEVTNSEISKLVRSKDYQNVGEVVESLTGIKTRRYEKGNLCPSDLAAEASLTALKAADMDAKDLDVIIFFGISRDVDEPATANMVQEKIGAKNAYVFDLANACNGFVTALDTLDALIASGRCEAGLITTGELISPYIDWEPKSKEDFKRSIFGYTIGDAGGAAVATRAYPNDERGIRGRWFMNHGEYWRLALAGCLPGANENNKYFKSRGLELELASIEFLPRAMHELLQLLHWTIEDVDMVVPHQIPTSIVENLYKDTLGIPADKLIWTFPKYGNNATASMPVAVCQAIKDGRLGEGDRVILAGGAAGFSTGFIGMMM